MVYRWETSDIKPGVRYTKESVSTTWIIGYLPYPLRTPGKYVSISVVDGLVTGEKSPDELVLMLNENGYQPENKELESNG